MASMAGSKGGIHMKKFKFILLDFKIHPKVDRRHVGWFLYVDNDFRFLNFIEKRAEALTHKYLETREIIRNQRNPHFYPDQAAIANTLANAEGRLTIIDDLKLINNIFLATYIKLYSEEKELLVNSNFACRPMGWEYKILKTVEKDDFIFPEEAYTRDHIKVGKWIGGNHYYAKIGPYSVVDDNGSQKWNTSSQAWEAAKTYLKKMRDE